jgi:hypothetical protein
MFKRVIRMYRSGKQKVPKEESGGTNGTIRRFKRVIIGSNRGNQKVPKGNQNVPKGGN